MITITRSPWGRRLIAALLTWFVPFLSAVPFYGKNGIHLIDPGLFKSIMIVVATITAAILMVWFFREIKSGFGHSLDMKENIQGNGTHHGL